VRGDRRVLCKRLTKLTKFSDKLVALSGLASDLGRSWDGVDYLAGLWSYRLRRGFLWRCGYDTSLRQKSYTAPSWSWASIDSKIVITSRYLFSDALAQVLETNVQRSEPSNPYCAVIDSYVRTQGADGKGEDNQGLCDRRVRNFVC
jgi:hypothetical protein